MRYQIILEFDEDWFVEEIRSLIYEEGIVCFYHIIDTEAKEGEEDDIQRI